MDASAHTGVRPHLLHRCYRHYRKTIVSFLKRENIHSHRKELRRDGETRLWDLRLRYPLLRDAGRVHPLSAKAFHDRAITPVRSADGKEVILAGHRIATFNSEAGLGFDLAYRPGSLKEMLKQMGSGNPDETYEPQPMQAEWLEREPRLRVMAEQNVERAVIFPAGGMALAAEHYVDDTAALYANVRSFNRWFDETWGFNYQDKIYATALLSLRDLESAIAETEAIIEQGAKMVLLPTGPAHGRSPGDPYFDPIYARLQEAGCTLVFHIQPFWYFNAISPAWGGHDPDPAAWHMSAWQWMNIYGQRPIEDTLSALIFDNLFGRFPRSERPGR